MIVLQTLPGVVLGLYTPLVPPLGAARRLGRRPDDGPSMLYETPNPLTGKKHFGGAQYALSHFGSDTEGDDLHRDPGARGEPVARGRGQPCAARDARPDGNDETHPADYHFEADDEVRPLPVSAGQEVPA